MRACGLIRSMSTIFRVFLCFLRNSLRSRAACKRKFWPCAISFLYCSARPVVEKFACGPRIESSGSGCRVGGEIGGFPCRSSSRKPSSLEPQELPVVLELEEPGEEGTATDMPRDSRFNPHDELGESALGHASHPRGTAEARHPGCSGRESTVAGKARWRIGTQSTPVLHRLCARTDCPGSRHRWLSAGDTEPVAGRRERRLRRWPIRRS